MPTPNVSRDTMALIQGLHQACARNEISNACMMLAAIDILRTEDSATAEDAVLFYRATCFILAGPFRGAVRAEMETSSIAWRHYLRSHPGNNRQAPRVATAGGDNADTEASGTRHIESELA
jgi:hypothetical protein